MRSVDCDELGEVGEIAVEPGDFELGGEFFFFVGKRRRVRERESVGQRENGSPSFSVQSLSFFSLSLSLSLSLPHLLFHYHPARSEAVEAQQTQPSRFADDRGGRGRHHRRGARKHKFNLVEVFCLFIFSKVFFSFFFLTK